MVVELELPEQPQLRSAALALEELQMTGQILDHKWRLVYLSSVTVTALDASQEDVSWLLGRSPIMATLSRRAFFGVPLESRVRFWETLGPVMRHDVPPEDPDFEAVFGPMAEAARELEPRAPDAVMMLERDHLPDDARRWAWQGTVRDLFVRLVGHDGEHVGTMFLTRPAIGDLLLARLALGHVPMYERMLELREPTRRPAAILFADLEASGGALGDCHRRRTSCSSAR